MLLVTCALRPKAKGVKEAKEAKGVKKAKEAKEAKETKEAQKPRKPDDSCFSCAPLRLSAPVNAFIFSFFNSFISCGIMFLMCSTPSIRASDRFHLFIF